MITNHIVQTRFVYHIIVETTVTSICNNYDILYNYNVNCKIDYKIGQLKIDNLITMLTRKVNLETLSILTSPTNCHEISNRDTTLLKLANIKM